MINAVRKLLKKNDTNKVLVQEQDWSGKKSELHRGVAKGVWQRSTLRSATFCWELLRPFGKLW